MTLFSRIRLDPEASQSPQFWRGLGDPYRIHTWIWDLFADHPDRRRDYLYRMDIVRGRPEVYTVSARVPEDQTGIWAVECKPYQPRLAVGQRLQFMTRVNPIVARRDEAGRQHRHDVVMVEKRRLRETYGPDYPVSSPVIVQREGEKWITSRGLTHGFAPVPGTVVAEGYQQLAFKKVKSGMQVNLSVLDLSGVLTVTDPEAFGAMLVNGLGPAKGFGCGLMMVKPLGGGE